MAEPVMHAVFTTTVRLLQVVLSAIASLIIYRVYLHPLASVPGPRLAAVSNIWHAYHARNGRMLRLGKTLHRVYGPVVRVGPNEVWINSKESFQKIYIALALHRPTLSTTLRLTFPDTLDLLGEFDMDRYRLQRRLIGPIYQKRNLLKYEDAIDRVLLKVIAKLEGLNGAEVDLKEWMHIITVECLTAVVLSWSPGYLQSNTDHGVGAHAYFGWRRKSVFGLFPWAELVDAYSRTLGRAFAKLWGLTFKPPPQYKALFPVLGFKTHRRIAAALRPIPPKDNRQDLAAELIGLHKEKSEFNETYLKRMIMTNFGAGHETTTSTLISVLSMLGSHPVTQAKAAVEARCMTDECQVLSYADAIELSYNQASIKEAQRLYPVIGMSLSRKVPATGLQTGSLSIPPGTTVGCNPVALHRNTDIFGPDAADFNPERWLDSERARDMDRYNLIWGGGARMCPGRNLAELIVFKVVPTLVKRFKIEVQMPPEEKFRFYFMAILTGVSVRFSNRPSAG